MIFKIWLLTFAALLIQNSRACNDDQASRATTLQDPVEEMLAAAYGLSGSPWQTPYYYNNPTAPRVAGFGNAYEGRSPSRQNINPLLSYMLKNNLAGEEDAQPEGRLFTNIGAQFLNSALFNNRFPTNTFRPFASLASRWPITINPNYPNPLTTFDGCKSPNNEEGICAPASVCSIFGGRPSGSCILGGVCCVTAIATCGGTVTLNNTYWQSPTTGVSSPSSCALTVRLNSQLLEQKKRPICQIRVDFISFSIAQPASPSGVCNVDTFQVGSTISKTPIICGDNSGQHMYIQVPNSGVTPTDLQLVFSFGQLSTASSTIPRSWNIKIAMLPCGADYLAPQDCLQYFTSSSGTVKSFNWGDVAPAATSVRQLANQDYNICFRPEVMSNQQASRICYSACTGLTNARSAFAVTGDGLVATAAASQTIAATGWCPGDFLGIMGGFDQAVPSGLALERYCGTAFNPASANAANAVVCTTAKPFRIYYRTNGDELALAAPNVVAAADIANTGFCLSYSQS